MPPPTSAPSTSAGYGWAGYCYCSDVTNSNPCCFKPVPENLVNYWLRFYTGADQVQVAGCVFGAAHADQGLNRADCRRAEDNDHLAAFASCQGIAAIVDVYVKTADGQRKIQIEHQFGGIG